MGRWQLENDNFIDINLSSIHKKSVKRCNAGINIKAPDPNFRKHTKLKPKGRYKLLQNMGIAPTTQIIVCLKTFSRKQVKQDYICFHPRPGDTG